MRTKFAIVVAVFAMWVGSERAAAAATYYVSTSGNDGNSCAQAQSTSTPKRTINNAVGCLTAGDTLLVRGGTYGEWLDSRVVPAGTSWSSPVRVAAYPGETVWMTPGSGAFRVLSFSGSQRYIEFDGINVDGSRVAYDTIKITTGYPNENAHHIRIKNAEIIGPVHSYNGGYTGVGIMAAAGDSTSVGANEFINLRVHGNMAGDADHGYYIQSPNNLIEGNDVYDFPGAGIQLYNGNGLGGSPDNNIIRNNIVHDARSTFSGQRHFGMDVTGNGNVVYNNLVYNIPSNGAITVGIYVFTGSNNRVYNNTVVSVNGDGIRVESGVSNTVAQNNIAYQNSGANFANAGTGTTTSNNLFGIDPMFVNPSGRNFQLQSSSPAIDNGTPISSVVTDLTGMPRPQERGYDIGAYEHSSSVRTASPPAAPKGVRIVSN